MSMETREEGQEVEKKVVVEEEEEDEEDEEEGGGWGEGGAWGESEWEQEDDASLCQVQWGYDRMAGRGGGGWGGGGGGGGEGGSSFWTAGLVDLIRLKLCVY